MSLSFEPDEQQFTVFGDPGLLRQALTNLIQNAVDSMADAATSTPKIDLALTIIDASVVVSVADNGPGFPHMDLRQLLEPYVTKRKKGTGLGLAIVSKVIEDHAGSLELAATPDGGALVTFRIPVFEMQRELKG